MPTLDLSTLLMILFYIGVGLYAWTRIGINFSATSVLFTLMYLLHGPAYLYYTRVWGIQAYTDVGNANARFFWTILSAAPGIDVIGTLDVALVLTFCCLAAGILFADVLLGSSHYYLTRALHHWRHAPIAASGYTTRCVVWLGVAGIALVLVPFAIRDHQITKVYEYFTSNLSEFGKIRMRRELGGSDLYAYDLALSTLLPFLAFALCAIVLFRAKTSWLIIAIIFVGLVILAKAATLSKAPPAVFLLQLLILAYASRSLQLSGLRLIFLSAAAVTVFIIMALVAIPELGNVGAALNFLFYRAFMIPNESLLEYFSAIPYVLPHIWGAGISGLSWLIGKSTEMPTFWLVGEAHRGVLGSTTTVMLSGDAWANFGWAGVVIAPFIAGFTVRYIDVRLIIQRGKSIATLAGLSLAHYGVFAALTTALQTAMLTGGLLLVLPLVHLIEGRVRRREAESLPLKQQTHLVSETLADTSINGDPS